MASVEASLISDGYSISGGRSDDLNDCEGEQLHSPVSSAGFHGGLHGFPSRVKSEDRDRRNEFYSLKRFILISLGIPTAPAMKNSCQNLCTCAAIPFYAMLFLWGIILIGISTTADSYLWKLKCPDFVPARFFTVLAGIFYIMLGLYWLLLFWWNRYYQANKEAHHKSFSVMALLWWFLSTYFTMVITGLATQVFQFRDIILSTGVSKSDNFIDCDSHSSPSSAENDVIHVPINFVPVWALCSMVMLLAVNLCTCIANAISLCRLNIKTNHQPCTA